jgi:hypothetical protein
MVSHEFTGTGKFEAPSSCAISEPYSRASYQRIGKRTGTGKSLHRPCAGTTIGASTPALCGAVRPKQLAHGAVDAPVRPALAISRGDRRFQKDHEQVLGRQCSCDPSAREDADDRVQAERQTGA